MRLLPLRTLGARETSPRVIEFGVLLPGIRAADGNRLFVKVIHERDQFLQGVPPRIHEMQQTVDPDHGEYWSTRVDLSAERAAEGSSWGERGRYVYRYQLERPGRTVDWIVDPLAREFGVGKLSAITVGYTPHRWSPEERAWRVPRLRDLVVYELMLTEFGGGIPGTIARLEYLRDLGVNCIEVLPVSNVSSQVDWGYLPIGYLGVDERFGRRGDFQALVDAAHRLGIAVVVDAVYGHTSGEFAYAHLYRELQMESPVIGSFAKDYFGEGTDYRKAFTRDFFFTVNHHWLDAYHVDGFRYDCVPNYYDGPTGEGYAALVYETHRLVASRLSDPYWARFAGGEGPRVIQCAEQLEEPVEVLEKTYSNCAWQNGTMDAARGVARGEPGALEALGFRLGACGYPSQMSANGDVIEKRPFQYLTTHDHSRFICNFGESDFGDPLLAEGDRGRWFKAQPYLIGLLAGCGVPLLWQGEELCESYGVPDQGFGRVRLHRPVRWEFFYDEPGRRTVSLVRRLLRLRRELPQLRGGDHYFYNDHERYLSRGVLVFHRRAGEALTVVVLNFSDDAQEIRVAFPLGGDYREELEGQENLTGVVAGEDRALVIPSNFGRVWTRT